jgi:hypothetical protein
MSKRGLRVHSTAALGKARLGLISANRQSVSISNREAGMQLIKRLLRAAASDCVILGRLVTITVSPE